MDAVSKAIKLNIQQHFERWASMSAPDGRATCEVCPFCEECELMLSRDDQYRYLCEIITGKDFGDMAGLRVVENKSK